MTQTTQFPYSFHGSLTITSGKCWVFPSTAQLDFKEVSDKISPFLSNWKNEDHPRVQCEWILAINQIIVVAVSNEQLPLSGCSMDALLRHVQKMEKTLNVQLMLRDIFYVDDTGVHAASRVEFANLISQHKVTENTNVIDTTINDVSKLKDLVVPLKDCWHAKAFASKLSM